ncbi:MAG: hypothetical protein MO852_16990, partial [Candidatus Devosia euplotis]|nr:hypothetical protein [Candidatus Devosia euplotis]
MRQGRADFAIIGATSLARLLAGLLSSAHGKAVLLQGGGQPGYRLVRRLDLSVAAITRQETWALLAACVPETTRLIIRPGKRAAITRLDPIMFADQAGGKQALGHVRHMAAAYGLAAERMQENHLGPQRDGVRQLPAGTFLSIQTDGQTQCMLEDEAI